MRAQTARLLRRYADAIGAPYRLVKKAWKATPRSERGVVARKLELAVWLARRGGDV